MAGAQKRHVIEAQIPALRRFAYALLRDPEAADDLVQDCLERALSRWHLFRPEAALRPWLFQVLRNLHIDGMRARARRGPHLAYDEAFSPAIDGGAEAAAHLGDVLAALDLLTLEQREVILLVGVEDFSYAETARILGVAQGTVMSRLARGRARLRALVEPGPDSGDNESASGPATGASLRRVK
ncbi:RNA polymerase sigma factor [Paenirhodobacter sp. CAU 1674]|uniref:RNA polymerase sigma factor n=1 Tax=Paenirhodobacter sp. CAU 1674 TaxID=3032596 RepID=UPI0023DB67FC|nr:RNA polymerase sigma factor [Paenirhodobacter sp. CAU 1674]MDF2141572.1 RNA polymerase sigma factor [Paenirhodobacter sp. CAU 1674]